MLPLLHPVGLSKICLGPPTQKFFKQVVEANERAWTASHHLKDTSLGDLSAEIVVQINTDGTVKHSILRSSGNQQFDNDALQASRSALLPAPPETWNPRSLVAVTFKARVRTKLSPDKYRSDAYVLTIRTSAENKWKTVVVPDEFKFVNLEVVIDSVIDERGKGSYAVKSASGDSKYDAFVLDVCKKTFIPEPPRDWDNKEIVELVFSSHQAGTVQK